MVSVQISASGINWIQGYMLLAIRICIVMNSDELIELVFSCSFHSFSHANLLLNWAKKPRFCRCCFTTTWTSEYINSSNRQTNDFEARTKQIEKKFTPKNCCAQNPTRKKPRGEQWRAAMSELNCGFVAKHDIGLRNSSAPKWWEQKPCIHAYRYTYNVSKVRESESSCKTLMLPLLVRLFVCSSCSRRKFIVILLGLRAAL